MSALYRLRRFHPLIVVLICLFSLVGLGMAQNGVDTCPSLVDVALESVNTHCQQVERNQACYGAYQVEATFREQATETQFTQPKDSVAVADLQKLVTAAFDPASGIGGVVVMKLQALIPNTLPGQAVTLVLMGNGELENAVSPEDTVNPADPVQVTTRHETVVYSLISGSFAPLTTVPAQTPLGLDGKNNDGMWYRTVVENYPAWISSSDFTPTLQTEALPIITSGRYGAMQAFTLSSGVGNPNCDSVPSALLVQAPETTEITLNINGADVNIGSSVLFEIPQEGNTLDLAVIDGHARLADGRTLLSGFRSSIALSPDDRRIIGDWMPIDAVDDTFLERAQNFSLLDGTLLNYAITLPTREGIERLIEAGAFEYQNRTDRRELEDFQLLNLALQANGHALPEVSRGIRFNQNQLQRLREDGHLNSEEGRRALQNLEALGFNREVFRQNNLDAIQPLATLRASNERPEAVQTRQAEHEGNRFTIQPQLTPEARQPRLEERPANSNPEQVQQQDDGATSPPEDLAQTSEEDVNDDGEDDNNEEEDD